MQGKEARVMQVRMAWPVRFALLTVGIFTALALTRGQEQPSGARLDTAKGKAAPGPASAPIGQTTPEKSLQDTIHEVLRAE